MANGIEQKDIKYSGYSTLPNDYLSADGGIAFSSGALFENGGIKAIPDAWRQRIIVEETAKVYIHHTINYYHYVVVYQKDNGILIYIIDREVAESHLEDVNGGDDKDFTIQALKDSCTALVVDTLVKEKDLEGETFVNLVCVGNTLVVSTTQDMHYYLCKPGIKLNKDGKDFEGNEYLTTYCIHPYIYLGNKVPSVSIDFGLDLECKSKTYFGTGVKKGKTEDSDGNTDEAKKHAKTIAAVSFYKEAGSSREDFALEYPIVVKKGQTILVRLDADYDDVLNLDSRTALQELDGDGNVITQYQVTHTNTINTTSRDITFNNIHVYANNSNEPAYGTVFVEILGDNYFNGNYFILQTSENYEAVLGCINKFVADYGDNKNKFIHPFFVRYAVRLYDNSVCEISPPILMTPNSGYAPFVWCNNSDNDKDGEADNLTLYAFIADLKLKMSDSIGSNWEDIIQSVDIYVSQPIYPYDQGKEYSEEENLFVFKDHIAVKYDNDYVVTDDISDLSFGIGNLIDTCNESTENKYRIHNLRDEARERYGFDFYTDDVLSLANNPWRVTQIAPKDTESLDQEIKDMSNFFLIKKITFDELKDYIDDFTDIDLEYGTLSSLEGRETLSEDTIQYERIIGGQLFSFNNRLHIFGGEIVFRDLVFPSLQVQHNDADNQINATNTAYVYIRTTEGVRIVKTIYDDTVLYTAGFIWIFYPDNRAFQIILSLNSGERSDIGEIIYTVYKFPLTEHNFLNGAQFFLRTDSGFALNNGDLDEYRASEDDIPSDDYLSNTVQATSIYISEIDNPFTFLNSSTVTAGSGKVLALSTAAQAMSQGQFGQYPVYVFTDEGIWVLSVADTGIYSTSQPLSRDVVINVDSITQLDSSVLFVTSRGIMEVAGSKIACITDSIDGENGQFDLTTLPGFVQLFAEILGYDDESIVSDILNKWAQMRFFDFIKDCRILYDYTHQRIIVYSADSPLGYSYSISSQAWSIIFTNLRQTILSYPNSLALREMTSEEVDEYFLDPEKVYWELVDMSEYAMDHIDSETSNDDELLEPALFVTQPMKFDMPDIYKTVDSIVQRGYFQQSTLENHVTASFLYASTDLFNWVLIGQSKTANLSEDKDVTVLSQGHAIRDMQGTPYKYYRVAVACQLTKKESISGCSILYVRKDDNLLR